VTAQTVDDSAAGARPSALGVARRLLWSRAGSSELAVRCTDGVLAPATQMMSVSFCAGAPSCYAAPPMLRAVRVARALAVQPRAACAPMRAVQLRAASVKAPRRAMRSAALPRALAAAADGHRATWAEHYEELKQYVASHGHALVPRRDPNLGRWVTSQREKRAAGKLTAEQVGLLDQLGFDWKPLQSQWMDMYEELKAFAAAHGHALVPRMLPGAQPLAEWCAGQRVMRRQGKLTAQRRALLDAVGFIYEVQDEFFETKLARLRAYAAAHRGSTEVTERYEPDSELGWWVKNSREACVRDELPANHAAQLAALSYAWSDADAAFAHGVAQLAAYAAAHGGSVAVPHGEDATTEETQLHEWCRMQRLRKQQGTLSAERIAQLEQVAGSIVWNEDDVVWHDWFLQLQAHAAANGGSTRVLPCTSPLARWASKQRELYATTKEDKKLHPSRVAQLESLQFTWKLR
jgi:hypothetical protein